MRRPYSVLLQVGFALPPPLPEARCALTAPFRPYRIETRRFVFCGTVPEEQGQAPAPRRVLPGTFTPWSPDFPPLTLTGKQRPPDPLALPI